jgi:peptide/nickel transport system ATP-binding protein
MYPPRRRGGERIRAVDGVTIDLRPGESLGLVGGSGSGKSTLTRLLLALERPDEGSVHFDGHPISDLPEHQVRPLRRRFQAVFQDPIGSLNPRLRTATIVAEPLVAHSIGTSAEQRRRVDELLEQVGLPDTAARRFPGAFSGGERQRIAVARALATGPELLILDEPVSSLDVSVQAQILDLLRGLRRRHGLAMIFVSHDLGVVRGFCDRVAVMHRGRIVEEGDTTTVLSAPTHDYTQQLLAGTHSVPAK